MQKLIAVSVALVASTSMVHAADLGVIMMPEAPAAMMSTGYDWTGFYAGLHGGVGFGENNAALLVDYPDFDAGDFALAAVDLGPDYERRENIDDIDLMGGIGGVQAGYNWQHGAIVFGLEADLSVANITGADDDENDVNNNGVATNYEALGSVRARVGVAADRLLAYATAGVAYARGYDSYTYQNLDDGFVADPATNDFSDIGYVIGAGAEYAITDSVSIKAEYQFAHFGESDAWDVDDAAGGEVFGPGSDTFEAIEHSVHTVRVGLNLSF